MYINPQIPETQDLIERYPTHFLLYTQKLKLKFQFGFIVTNRYNIMSSYYIHLHIIRFGNQFHSIPSPSPVTITLQQLKASDYSQIVVKNHTQM